MMDEGFRSGLADALEIEPSQLTSGYRLADSDMWDSMTVVTVIALIDEHYGKSVEGQALAECETVGDIETLVEGG